MSGHTPGRVRLCTPEYAIYLFSELDGAMVADRPIGEEDVHLLRARGTGHGRSAEEQKANMRRFAAAWNAAHEAGLSTEALEEGAVQRAFLSLGRIADRIQELKAKSNVLSLPEATELHDEAIEALIRARLHACDGNHAGAPCWDRQCWKR